MFAYIGLWILSGFGSSFLVEMDHNNRNEGEIERERIRQTYRQTDKQMHYKNKKHSDIANTFTSVTFNLVV